MDPKTLATLASIIGAPCPCSRDATGRIIHHPTDCAQGTVARFDEAQRTRRAQARCS